MSGDLAAKAGAATYTNLDRWWQGAPTEDADIDVLVQASAEQLKAVDDRIQIIDTIGDDQTLCRIPRYLLFKDIVIKLANQGINLIRIAGNSMIQITVSGPAYVIDNLARSKLWTLEYTYPLPAAEETEVAAITVKVVDLDQAIPALEHQGLTIKYIHDF